MAKRILVIDDDPVVLNMVSVKLRARGYEVFSAGYGQEGVVLLKSLRPDLIILDYRLPDMPGSDISQQIMSNGALSSIPILLITASTETIIEKAKKCGARDYLPKPVDTETLLEKVAQCLEK